MFPSVLSIWPLARPPCFLGHDAQLEMFIVLRAEMLEILLIVQVRGWSRQGRMDMRGQGVRWTPVTIASFAVSMKSGSPNEKVSNQRVLSTHSQHLTFLLLTLLPQSGLCYLSRTTL